jgi:hypothetical protein
MKIRIKGNSLRIRLTKSELAQIQEGLAVSEAIYFSPKSKLTYSLVPKQDAKSIEAHFDGQTIEVSVPMIEAQDWASSSTVSLKTNLATENPDALFILIEKDFFCLKPRNHEIEDESDLFDNPNLAHGSCG